MIFHVSLSFLVMPLARSPKKIKHTNSSVF
jgi:hypothetical protein